MNFLTLASLVLLMIVSVVAGYLVLLLVLHYAKLRIENFLPLIMTHIVDQCAASPLDADPDDEE